jgi:hypothetical protein
MEAAAMEAPTMGAARLKSATHTAETAAAHAAPARMGRGSERETEPRHKYQPDDLLPEPDRPDHMATSPARLVGRPL